MNEHLDPLHIMQTATAFWASKRLLTAVELDLFTNLGDEKWVQQVQVASTLAWPGLDRRLNFCFHGFPTSDL